MSSKRRSSAGKGPPKKRKRAAADQGEKGEGAAEQEGLRRWDRATSHAATRNVRYSNHENERLLEALRVYKSERGLDKEDSAELFSSAQEGRRTWCRVAHLANVDKRSVQSVSQRVRRMLLGGHGQWTQEQTERLADEVLSCGATAPPWTEIASRIGGTPEHCRDKWKGIFQRQSRGAWNTDEEWALRQGICELTNCLVPVCEIPWRKVRAWVPHRSSEQCRLHWYRYVQPRLLEYQTKHGLPIPPEVFQRLILYNLRKVEAEEDEEVNWQDVNRWWQARVNRRQWLRLQMPLPNELREAPVAERAQWLAEAMQVKSHRKRDKKVLKHARLVLENDARALELADSDVARLGGADDAHSQDPEQLGDEGEDVDDLEE